MNTPTLSVIVPVFNTEKYVANCIESILNQTYQDYELVLVNDGSTDESGIICDRYASKDCRIIFINKTNGGPSSARNIGLNLAAGKYITFVDSDDRIALDTYQANMEILMQDPDIDILQYPTDWGKANSEDQPVKQQVFLGEKEIFSNWWEGPVLNASVCNKIFHRRIFFDIRFPEGCFFEDMFLIVDFSETAKKVVTSENGEYFYLVRTDSISNIPNYSLKKNLDLLAARFKIYKKLFSFEHLRPYRLIDFSRVCRRLVLTKSSDPNAELDSYIGQITAYIPSWKDIFVSKSDIREIIWFFFIKVLGLSSFMKLFIKYIHLKEKF